MTTFHSWFLCLMAHWSPLNYSVWTEYLLSHTPWGWKLLKGHSSQNCVNCNHMKGIFLWTTPPYVPTVTFGIKILNRSTQNRNVKILPETCLEVTRSLCLTTMSCDRQELQWREGAEIQTYFAISFRGAHWHVACFSVAVPNSKVRGCHHSRIIWILLAWLHPVS